MRLLMYGELHVSSANAAGSATARAMNAVPEIATYHDDCRCISDSPAYQHASPTPDIWRDFTLPGRQQARTYPTQLMLRSSTLSRARALSRSPARGNETCTEESAADAAQIDAVQR